MADKKTPTKKRNKTVKINVGEFPYVDIMPSSRHEAIERGIAKGQWMRRVTGSLIVVLIASGGAFGYKLYNQGLYDAEVLSKNSVEQQIAQRSDVDQALTIKTMVEENIKKSVANEIDWDELLKRVQGNLPENSQLSTISVMTGGTIEGKPSVGVQIQIISQFPIAYSQVVTALSGVPGIITDSLEIGNMSSVSTPGPLDANGKATDAVLAYTYPITFSIDTSLLRFVKGEPQSGASNAAGGTQEEGTPENTGGNTPDTVANEDDN